MALSALLPQARGS